MSSVHYVFCGVQRSIEQSVSRLQVDRAMVGWSQVASGLCSGCDGHGLQVESRLLRVESKKLPRVYVDSRV